MVTNRLVAIAVLLSISGCNGQSTSEHPFCQPLQMSSRGTEVAAVCFAQAQAVQLILDDGVFGSESRSLRSVLLAFGRPESSGKTINGDPSRFYAHNWGQLEAVCKSSGTKTCAWELNFRPSADSTAQPLTSSASEILGLVKARYPEVATARLAFMFSSETGSGLNLEFERWKLTRVLWYDPTGTQGLDLKP